MEQPLAGYHLSFLPVPCIFIHLQTCLSSSDELLRSLVCICVCSWVIKRPVLLLHSHSAAPELRRSVLSEWDFLCWTCFRLIHPLRAAATRFLWSKVVKRGLRQYAMFSDPSQRGVKVKRRLTKKQPTHMLIFYSLVCL